MIKIKNKNNDLDNVWDNVWGHVWDNVLFNVRDNVYYYIQTLTDYTKLK